MKKILFSLLLTAVATWLALPACKKDDLDCPPDLPCATQTGENTFGCYINGKPWVAGIAPYILDPTLHKIVAIYDEPNYGKHYFNGFQLFATKVDSTSHDFWKFSCSPIFSAQELRHDNMASLSFYLRSSEKYYYFDTVYPYKILITNFDTIKNTASGIFEFIMVSHDKKDTAKVTDGRFDVRYYPE